MNKHKMKCKVYIFRGKIGTTCTFRLHILTCRRGLGNPTTSICC